MAICLGKNQSLGYFLTPGKQGCIESILKSTDNGADLTGVHNIPIKLRGTVINIFVQLCPPLFSGKAVAVFHHLLEDGATLLAYFCFNQEDILTHIDAIDDGLLSGVFADNILIEERKSALVRCCGQANLESVKVLQHLFPHIVDGSVALVDDNYIKEFGRVFSVINNFLGGLLVDRGIFKERFAFGGLIQLLTPENGVHALDGTDTHLHIGRNKGRFQSTNTIQFGERTVIVIGSICQEFTLCLFTQALGIYQEQYSIYTGVLQQTINGSNCGKGFTRTGSHLDQRLRLIGSKRFLQIADGGDLALAETGSIKIRELLHAVADRIRLFHQPLQFLRLMEREDCARTVLNIVIVSKTSQFSSSLINKTNLVDTLDPFESTVYIAVRLTFYCGNIFTGIILFGLDNANRSAINKQSIVNRTGAGGEFTHRNAQSRKEIELLHILDDPSGLLQLLVYSFSGFLLRCHTAFPFR